MNKKIASEFAFGIIMLIAIIVSGIFWLSDKKQELQNQYLQSAQKAPKSQSVKVNNPSALASEKEQAQPVETTATCTPRYYEGQATIQGWPDNSVAVSGTELAIDVKNQDIEKLPTVKSDSLQPTFTVILVDPTVQNKTDLQKATEENPAILTIRGFAQICQSYPRVSVQQATVAFKKS